MALSNKQRVFVEEYLQCWNATEAARRAGYSPKTAYSIGQENLRKPEIAAAVKARINEKTMQADEVLARLSEQGRADIGQFFKIVEEWTFYPLPTYDILDAIEVIDDSDPEKPITRVNYLVRHVALHMDKLVDPQYSHLLHKVSATRKGGLQIELYDKQAALVHLGKHLGLFVDRIKHEDWRSEAIEYIRKGELDYGALADELGTDLATELFAAAGIAVSSGTGAGE